MDNGVVVMGAVAYDPKVVTIWDGFRRWFASRDLAFDYVLYSNYERQVEDLIAGRIAAAWNSPLAWIRAERLAAATGLHASALAMRDTDRDLSSVIVVRSDSPIADVQHLAGRIVATGAVDSPQATLLPLDLLRDVGIVPGKDVEVRRFDVGVGLHGDHIGGERDAARALVQGEVDAACMIDSNHLLFASEGLLPAGSTRIVAQTRRYDHCNMTVVDRAEPQIARFADHLFAMDFGDPAVRPLLELEGLKRWLPGRVEGYAPLARAVDRTEFYDDAGAITAIDYRP